MDKIVLEDVTFYGCHKDDAKENPEERGDIEQNPDLSTPPVHENFPSGRVDQSSHCTNQYYNEQGESGKDR